MPGKDLLQAFTFEKMASLEEEVMDKKAFITPVLTGVKTLANILKKVPVSNVKTVGNIMGSNVGTLLKGVESFNLAHPLMSTLGRRASEGVGFGALTKTIAEDNPEGKGFVSRFARNLIDPTVLAGGAAFAGAVPLIQAGASNLARRGLAQAGKGGLLSSPSRVLGRAFSKVDPITSRALRQVQELKGINTAELLLQGLSPENKALFDTIYKDLGRKSLEAAQGSRLAEIFSRGTLGRSEIDKYITQQGKALQKGLTKTPGSAGLMEKLRRGQGLSEAEVRSTLLRAGKDISAADRQALGSYLSKGQTPFVKLPGTAAPTMAPEAIQDLMVRANRIVDPAKKQAFIESETAKAIGKARSAGTAPIKAIKPESITGGIAKDWVLNPTDPYSFGPLLASGALSSIPVIGSTAAKPFEFLGRGAGQDPTYYDDMVNTSKLKGTKNFWS